jgi:hypothetical protein
MVSEQDHHPAQLHSAQAVLGLVLVAHEQSAEVLQPGTQAFALPATTVPLHGSSILRGRLRPVGAGGAIIAMPRAANAASSGSLA